MFDCFRSSYKTNIIESVSDGEITNRKSVPNHKSFIKYIQIFLLKTQITSLNRFDLHLRSNLKYDLIIKLRRSKFKVRLITYNDTYSPSKTDKNT